MDRRSSTTCTGQSVAWRSFTLLGSFFLIIAVTFAILACLGPVTFRTKMMDKRKTQLLDRLKLISPMPNDDEVSQEQLDGFQNIVGLIQLHYAQEIDFLGPMLDSFGSGDGYGLYEGVAEGLATYPRQPLLNTLIDRIASGSEGSKAWSLHILAELHKAREPPVQDELKHLGDCAKGSTLVRRETANCLGALGNVESLRLLKELADDPDEPVSSVAKKWLLLNASLRLELGLYETQ